MFVAASKYEAMLLERGGVGLNEDKTLLVFQILDQIIPHLGVFTQVMKSCRDELFGSFLLLCTIEDSF